MLRFNRQCFFCIYLISYNNIGFFIIFPMIVSIIYYSLLSSKVIVADRIFVFYPALLRDFLLFVFCLSGSCTGVRKDPKNVSFLASICNLSLSCLYLFNKRRFRQVPRRSWYFAWNLQPTLDERSSTMMCSGKHKRYCCTTIMINFVIWETSRGKWSTIAPLWS